MKFSYLSIIIIGILSSVALPQYKIAVTKAKVTAMLPTMRSRKDALMQWKLIHGTYCKGGTDRDCDDYPTGSDLGVVWPSDFKLSILGNAVI